MRYTPFPFYAYLGENDYVFAAYEKRDYEIAFGELERLFSFGVSHLVRGRRRGPEYARLRRYVKKYAGANAFSF